MEGIVTPEAVVLDLETAGVASRVFAGLLDFLVQAAILFVGVMLIVAVSFGDGSAAVLPLSLLTAGVMMGYPLISETAMRGRTIGKRAMGLRAVTVEGAPIRLRHALLRMMGGLVDRYLPPLGVTGMLFVLGTSRHQRVGDLLAGTIVIRDPERTPLPAAVWFPVPPGLESFAATIDPTAMTDEQYTVIRSFLMRSRELSFDARLGVAADLAQRSATTLGHGSHRSVHPEAYLLCVISRYQRRNFPNYQPTSWQAR
ncbi:MAG: RDD family protein [Actinobacteria bacterium]|nr:RDD family protein [Actinomycetota bacterium]